MRAALWYGRKDVRIENVPEPLSPEEDEVLVKIVWCGICGTDLHEYLTGPITIPAKNPHPLTKRRAPIILGHEAVGEVLEVGEKVSHCEPGDRVVFYPVIGCGGCWWCREGRPHLCSKVAFIGSSWDGGMAEYMRVPALNCYPIPPSLSSEEATLVEPFAAAVRATKRADIKPDESVMIVGSGTIGLCVLQALRARGVESVFVVEKILQRRKIAEQLGARKTFDPTISDIEQKIFQLTEGLGPQYVFECVGTAVTADFSFKIVRKGGTIVILGIFEEPAPFNYTDLVYSEKKVLGSMGGGEEFGNTIQILASPKITLEPLITKKISLSSLVEEGFEPASRHKEKHIKILVDLQK
ncbi:2,3-butanediol dehydrogenase [Candidatus Aerophobetes bacterium]|uniref:2,3-butanediol dehydrogenase n=1 Tax=Aerophobetes bacterium TaxID=2030807 RepID=A0A523RNE1_UNCAE|nr:MAG: 2,3-butanediol dehydrogenase [Candidatus Aerophobetes bacterium]